MSGPDFPHSIRRMGALLDDVTAVKFGKQDLSLAQCRLLAASNPKQPDNALYSRTDEERAVAMFGFAGPRLVRLGGRK